MSKPTATDQSKSVYYPFDMLGSNPYGFGPMGIGEYFNPSPSNHTHAPPQNDMAIDIPDLPSLDKPNVPVYVPPPSMASKPMTASSSKKASKPATRKKNQSSKKKKATSAGPKTRRSTRSGGPKTKEEVTSNVVLRPDNRSSKQPKKFVKPSEQGKFPKELEQWNKDQRDSGQGLIPYKIHRMATLSQDLPSTDAPATEIIRWYTEVFNPLRSELLLDHMNQLRLFKESDEGDDGEIVEIPVSALEEGEVLDMATNALTILYNIDLQFLSGDSPKGVHYAKPYEEQVANLFRCYGNKKKSIKGESELVSYVKTYRNRHTPNSNVEVYRGVERTFFYHESFVEGQAGRDATMKLTCDGSGKSTKTLTAPKGYTLSREDRAMKSELLAKWNDMSMNELFAEINRINKDFSPNPKIGTSKTSLKILRKRLTNWLDVKYPEP